MAKPSEPKKAPAKAASAKTGAAKSSNETPVSSKENPAPAKTKTGNTASTRPAAQVQGKAPPSTKTGARKGDHTEATGRDHPSQSEHAKALWQKLHGTSDQRTRGGPPGGAPGQKKGFDPNQIRGGKGNFGGAHGSMIRRTQSRGGGSGGGGGGGGSAG